MRMRRKSNLDERLQNASEYLLAYEGSFTNVNEYIKDKAYIDYKEVFKNSNPVCLDLGCGLGGFAIEFAQRHKDINLIGVEMFSNVIIGAIDKASQVGLNNLKFLNCRIECLEKYITPHSIDTIYLNFSNPLPNKSDAKQRLTSPRFLKLYKLLLKEGGYIIQKTDDKDFFAYSLEKYREEGFELSGETWDLESLYDSENIQTEHEKKYIREGKKIHRVIACPKMP